MDPDSLNPVQDSLNPDPDSLTKKLKKIQLKQKIPFFDQELQFSYPLAFLKDVQAFSPQKRKSSSSKNLIY
jgi:hypothetical protein